MLVQVTKVLIWELLREIIYFPVWWYTQGLKRYIIYIYNSIKKLNRNLSLTLMLKNMGKPMFGQFDRAGRVVSFFMRFVLLISRLVVFILFLIFYLLLLIFWLITPVAVVFLFIRNLNLS